MKRNLLGLSFVALLALAPGARADADSGADAQIPIARFSEVSPGVYRGARPGAEGLKALHDVLHIKTDIDLDDSKPANAAEAAAAKALDIDFVGKPMSAFWEPSDNEVNSIIAIMADPANRPVFVHCKAGQDRTGMIVGVYRVMVEGVKPADAIAEALKHGFHEILLPMDYYFHQKTENEYEALHSHPTPDDGSATQINL